MEKFKREFKKENQQKRQQYQKKVVKAEREDLNGRKKFGA